MLVSDILKAKGRDVITGSPGETLREIAALLSEHRIGAVLVVNPGGRVEGILSERDIVKAVAREGAKALELSASEVMTRRVVSCREGDTIDYLMERMTEGRFRHLPVIEAGALVGLVSIGDVVKRRLQTYEVETQAMREYIAMA